MATQPTNLPVPSESPRDVKFNAGKIDEFVTSLVNNYVDRFGNEHYTIEGLRWLAQQAIAQFGWIPVGTFQDGATLTLPNQILKDVNDGNYYRWDGALLPDGKVVPENSTPLSTGGIGVGAWISVGDSSLRAMLATSQGATMIGVSSGGTVQDDLNKLDKSSFVCPEMYMTGNETDHTAAFKQALTEAKAKNKKFLATGNYVLSASDDPISIEVDADMSMATVTCSTYQSGDVFSLTYTLFDVPQEEEDVTSRFTNGMFFKGNGKVAVSGLEGSIYTKSTEVFMVRNNSGVTTDVLKQEVNQIDTAGNLKYRNYLSYSNLPTVYYKGFNHELYIKLPRFILNGTRISNLIKCSRNNSHFYGGSVSLQSDGFARQFLELVSCARITVDGFQVSPIDISSQGGGYFAEMLRCSEVTFRNVVSISSNFGGIDGGAFRDVIVDRSDVYEIAGHYLISDYQITNSTFRWRCSGQGWGVFRIKNCIQLCPERAVTHRTLTTRDDYMSSWDGTFEVDGLKVVLSVLLNGYYCVSCPEPKYNGNYIGYCPNVTIRNVEIDNSLANSIVNFRVLDLGVSTNNQYEQYQIFPQYHDISDVRMVGDLTYNGIVTNAVFNGRNYTFLTASQLNGLSRGPYRIRVSNVDLRRCGRGQDVGLPRYNVFGFSFTTYGLSQYIEVENSYNCIPIICSLNDMNINVRNQTMCFGAQDSPPVSRTANSNNRVRFFGCLIYSPDQLLNEATYRSGIYDYHSCYFGWKSTISGIPETANDTIGTKLSSTVGPLGKINGCSIFVPLNSFQLVDATFLSRIANNYTNTGYYKTS